MITLKLLVPERSAALAGNCALLSDDMRPTTSVTVLTRFQFESTAFTVRLKGDPAVCEETVPPLPLAVPGAAVSPGANIWSLAKIPGVTAIDGVVEDEINEWVTLLAVTV